MKQILKSLRSISILFLLLISQFAYPQDTFSYCTSFENDYQFIKVDANSNWEIGHPSTIIFDSSFSVNNSIVTNLDSTYNNSDSVFFFIVIRDSTLNEIPNYLGYIPPLKISFIHRFETSSFNDYGIIEYSTTGENWKNLQNSKYNTYLGQKVDHHINLTTGDTLSDSLRITGSSNGWVESLFIEDIDEATQDTPLNNDSLILRFSFVSDSINVLEGWQIDNLCIEIDVPTFISEEKIDKKSFRIYPNPSKGEFVIDLTENFDATHYKIIDSFGNSVITGDLNGSDKSFLSLNLNPGLYTVVFSSPSEFLFQRLIIY